MRVAGYQTRHYPPSYPRHFSITSYPVLPPILRSHQNEPHPGHRHPGPTPTASPKLPGVAAHQVAWREDASWRHVCRHHRPLHVSPNRKRHPPASGRDKLPHLTPPPACCRAATGRIGHDVSARTWWGRGRWDCRIWRGRGVSLSCESGGPKGLPLAAARPDWIGSTVRIVEKMAQKLGASPSSDGDTG